MHTDAWCFLSQILEQSLPEGGDMRLFRQFLSTFVGPMFARCSSRIEDLQVLVSACHHDSSNSYPLQPSMHPPVVYKGLRCTLTFQVNTVNTIVSNLVRQSCL